MQNTALTLVTIVTRMCCRYISTNTIYFYNMYIILPLVLCVHVSTAAPSSLFLLRKPGRVFRGLKGRALRS